jgi:hypothetical protein
LVWTLLACSVMIAVVDAADPAIVAGLFTELCATTPRH